MDDILHPCVASVALKLSLIIINGSAESTICAFAIRGNAISIIRARMRAEK